MSSSGGQRHLQKIEISPRLLKSYLGLAAEGKGVRCGRLKAELNSRLSSLARKEKGGGKENSGEGGQQPGKDKKREFLDSMVNRCMMKRRGKPGQREKSTTLRGPAGHVCHSEFMFETLVGSGSDSQKEAKPSYDRRTFQGAGPVK